MGPVVWRKYVAVDLKRHGKEFGVPVLPDGEEREGSSVEQAGACPGSGSIRPLRGL